MPARSTHFSVLRRPIGRRGYGRGGGLALGGLALLAAAGCATRLMPTPVVYADGAVDLFEATAPAERDPSVAVFYATDRAPTAETDPEQRYGSARGFVLRLGRAQVRLGPAGTTWTDLRDETAGVQPVQTITEVEEMGLLWTTIPDPTPEAVLRGWDERRRDDPERRGAYAFAAAVNETLARSERQDITVFVPGINTDFAWPIKAASGVRHFMARDGVTLAYCWPSSGNALAYGQDTETAALTVRSLRDLLLFLSIETDARRIHVVGYSRGAAIVSAALLQIRLIHANDDVDTIRRERRIGTVVYAGPDEDLMIFKSLYLDRIDDLVEAFLVYASPRDHALSLSRMFTSGTERLGRPETGISAADLEAMREDMVSAFVNVEHAQDRAGEGAAGHAFWYQNPWVSSDLVVTLRYGLRPAGRGLVRAEDGGTWVFPDDYPERVRAIVAEQEGR